METPVAAPPPTPYREDLPPQPPGPPEGEQHFAGPRTGRELATGLADGLILPFAVTAGLTGAVADTQLIATAGLAAIAAGCVALGLGHLLAARTEARHYAAERLREEQETKDYPEREKWEVSAILHRYGLRGEILARASDAIASDRRRWVDFMMRFELELAEPVPGEAGPAAAAMGAAHLAAGAIPVLPYVLLAATGPALALSAGLTGVALLAFGWLKARASGLPPARGAMQALATGAAAAAAAHVAVVLASG